MRYKLSQLLLFFIFISSTTISFAQNYAGHHWYFGGSTQGVRFSRSDNSASLTSLPSALGAGASAVVSNPVNGNLLFYTDGVNVYDATHQIMPNGAGLNGNISGKQSTAVAKVPGQPDQYYVFVNNGAGQISYRIIDMTAFGNAVFPTPALGNATTNTNTDVAALNGRSEAMIIIPHENGTDSWLITHQNGSTNYTITLIDAAGVGVTSVTQPGNIGLITSVGNFSYHEATGGLAVSPDQTGRNVEILNFDNSTGILTFDQAVPLTSVATGTEPVFDTEWSNNGDYLYLSKSNGPADVLQFDVQNPSTTLASVLPQPNTITASYGLQMAPDSAIYHLYQATAGGAFLLGKITDTDTVASEVTYQTQAFPGNINFNAQQFPAFATASDVDLTASFTASGLCANSPTSFYPTVTPGADSVRWDLEPGAVSRAWSPVHTYQAGGTVSVTLTAFLNGDSIKSNQQLPIADFDTQITLVQDTTACSCELPFPKEPATPCGSFSVTAQVQGSGSPSLQWYGPGGLIQGATTATLAPDSAGFYYLVATVNGVNCQAYAGVNIKEYGVEDQRANIWYFGNNAGLDFNPMFDTPPAPGPTPISNPVMQAPEGTATISDRNGQVIFFTDGETVWDREFTPIGTSIGGSKNAVQSSLIMPVPGDETLYYIFTTQEIYGTGTYQLRYTLFDLKLNGGTGGIVDPDQNPLTTELSTLLFELSTERITANANWIIAHEYGNNSFRAYQITAQGISNAVISGVGSDHSFAFAENGQGYMKLSSQNTLAVALPTPGVSNIIEIFDFNNTTGEVSNMRRADLEDASGVLYGIEFSPSARKLYASTIGNSQLFELVYDSATTTYRRVPEIPPVTPPQQIGAIQVGPGGSIYVANEGGSNLGTIQPIELDDTPSTFTPDGQPLFSGTNSTLGLPNFSQIIADPMQEPGIAVTGICLGDTTNFSATGTDIIDEFQWVFGDGQSATGQTAQHVYAAAGTYTVALTISNRCGLDTLLTQEVTIVAPPAPPTFLPPGQFPVLCNGPLTLEATPANNPDLANLTFAWSTSETTRTIVATQQNIYSVTITNTAGCTSDGEITVADNRPIVDLGPDQTVCQNERVTTLDAQNRGAQYVWSINETPNGNTQRTQAVNTAIPGSTEYKVRITDPVTACVVFDSVRFNVNALPAFTTVVTDPTACGANGSIGIDITGPTGSLFSYSITGPTPIAPATDQDLGPIDNNPIQSLDAGNYAITITDQISNCAATETVSLNDDAFDVIGNQNGTCDPDIKIDVTTDLPTATDVNYRVINAATGNEVPPGLIFESDGETFLTSPTVALRAGNTYIVEVTEIATTCLSSSPAITLIPGDSVQVTFDESQLCTNKTLIASATGATSFDWSQSPVGSVSPTNQSTVNVASGIWDLIVVADDGPGGDCPGTGTITVNVDNVVNVALGQSDPCTDQATLTASVSPPGSYLYRWFRNGALDLGLAGPTVTATPANDGHSYNVTIYNPVNGCNTNSQPLTVQVDGELTVALTTTPPCEGQSFTLTATPNRTASIFEWSLDGTVLTGQTTGTLVVTDEQEGSYSVTATEDACEATTSTEIIISPATPGNLNARLRICPDPANPDPATREAVLYPGDFVSYDWFRDGVSLSYTDSAYTTEDEGEYTVNLVNVFGCTSTDKAEVVVDCDPVIVGPNAFRPTSSLNENQAFKLFTFFIDDEDFQVFIFNRWGEMVFQSNERSFAWNGGYNNKGQLLPGGTYTYLVRYKSSFRPEDGVREKRGGVVLMK